ncbi:MAG TPA: ABC transporter ATP-binding protein, partial [Chitinophagaceae bacterium]|nr:ABC transporter ATP-binding protein [Chitinophagaceae bacterium]
MTSRSVNPVRRILELLAYERKDITAIYFYATFSGLVQLSLPLGIQSIISYVMGGSISTSLVLLIILVVGGVAIQGLLQVNQLKIIEKIQQQLFVRYSFLYAYHLPAVNLREVDAYYMPEQVNRFFDTVSLQKGLSKLLIDIPTASIQILFGLILLSLYHPIFIFFSISLITILFLLLRYTGNKG